MTAGESGEGRGRGPSPLSAAVGRPVTGQGQNARRIDSLLLSLSAAGHQLVALGPVAAEMRELKVVEVAGVSAFDDGDDVVDAGRERMRELIAEIDRLAADAANGLRRIDLLLFRSKARRCVPSWSGRSLRRGVLPAIRMQPPFADVLCGGPRSFGFLCPAGSCPEGGGLFEGGGALQTPGV